MYPLKSMDICEIEEKPVRKNILTIAAVCMKANLIPCGKINISCLAAYPLEKTDGRMRLAFGQENGSITIFNIDLSTWELEEVVKYSYHQKAVRHIAFIDDSRIVSGGTDRKLFLTQLDRNETIADKPIEFRLHLQCKGMKVDGVQPPETRLLLEKLIAKASSVK
jgi:hypothetical protein